MSRHADPVRREHLLDQVARYILDVGLAELSLRPLAAELRTSPRMLLYYFGSKESLLAEALRRIRLWQQQEAAKWSVESGGMEAAQVLERAWEWFSSKAAEPFMRLFFEVYGLALQEPARYREFLNDVVVDWLPLAETVVKNAGITAPEAEQCATLLIAAHRGLLLDLLATGDRRRIDGSHKRLIAMLTADMVGA